MAVMSFALKSTEAGARAGGQTVNNLRFADDIDRVAEGDGQQQELTDEGHSSSQRFGLKINVEKTMTIGKQQKTVEIKIEGETLEQVTEFIYLGGVITEDGRCTKDIRRRIGLASAMFDTMNKVWRSKNITTATKVKLYGTLVIPVMMYGSECWCLRKEDERRILLAEMSWLRRILGRSRRDRIRNEVIRKELGQQVTWAETWRRIWGDQKFFRGPMSIFRVQISDDLFLVIELVLRFFPFFSHIFRMFTMLNVVR